MSEILKLTDSLKIQNCEYSTPWTQRKLNVLCTFNLCPVSRGYFFTHIIKFTYHLRTIF